MSRNFFQNACGYKYRARLCNWPNAYACARNVRARDRAYYLTFPPEFHVSNCNNYYCCESETAIGTKILSLDLGGWVSLLVPMESLHTEDSGPPMVITGVQPSNGLGDLIVIRSLPMSLACATRFILMSDIQSLTVVDTMAESYDQTLILLHEILL